MSAIANVTAYDGESTPVGHTFTAIMVKNLAGRQVASYRETANNTIPLEAQPSIELSQETLKSGVYKYVARVSLPVMESVSGNNSAGYTSPPKVAHTVTGEMTVYAHPRSTNQQRRNVRHILANLLFGYQSTLGPYTTGPVAELVDGGISPT